MEKEIFIKNILAANKSAKCDLVIKNITIIDVFQGSSFIADVAIANGYIVGLGEYTADTEIDGTGKYICPGLIDGHAHIESSLLTPKELYKCYLLHGVTSLIADPHEIGNVLGSTGIQMLLDLSKNIPFDFHFMLPSCVPATDFENSGAILKSEDLKPFYSDKKVLGLGEVMNSPNVLSCDDDMVNKLLDAINSNCTIDGHCAGFNIDMLNVYGTANIRTDHESINIDELIDRVRRGIYVLMREGTVAKNLKDLVNGVTLLNSRRLCLCTDDKHIDDIIKDGTIDYSIKICIENGISPEIAIQLGTLNTAECFGLKNKGAIAPGYIADFIILNDLEGFKIDSVYKNGALVVKDNKLINEDTTSISNVSLHTSLYLPEINSDSFKLDLTNKTILNVMELIPNKLESNHKIFNIEELGLKKEFKSITDKTDLVKISVIERHRGTGNFSIGVLNGLKLKTGAIATTIAHDSHNLIVCGTNDDDMAFAVNELQKIGGGIIVVENGKVLSSIALEIGGIITSRPAEDVVVELEHLHDGILQVAPEIDFNPFLTLSFLSLPVIPSIKITDKGLFNVETFSFIETAE